MIYRIDDPFATMLHIAMPQCQHMQCCILLFSKAVWLDIASYVELYHVGDICEASGKYPYKVRYRCHM